MATSRISLPESIFAQRACAAPRDYPPAVVPAVASTGARRAGRRTARCGCRRADWRRNNHARPDGWRRPISPAARAPRSRNSSCGLEMYAVSTSIDGMSGDFSTTNPACCTCACAPRRPVRAVAARPAAAWLALNGAVCDISSSAEASTIALVVEIDPADQVGRVLVLGQPGAASLVAPCCDRTYTDEPSTRAVANRIGVNRDEQVRLTARARRMRPAAARNSRRRGSAWRACRAPRSSCA